MTIYCYTSFSLSYLARARTLAASVRRHHPDWRFTAILCDELPTGLNVLDGDQFDEIIEARYLFEDLGPAWIFQHNIVELCTAVKGRALQLLLSRSDCTGVVYLDPDIAVFSPLTDVIRSLNHDSILLTPHQINPDEDEMAIRDNEIASLQYGVFNLGFLAVRNDGIGRDVADWWAERLERYCHDNLSIGLFVDQKWFNLAPAMFEGVKVLRDPGLNVASWNLSQREVRIGLDGVIRVNDRPLVFFHFTKFGHIGEVMTHRYARGRADVFELWAWYRLELERHSEPSIPDGWWAYGAFQDGSPIPEGARRLYRTRRDLRDAFPDPFSTDIDPSFRIWLSGHMDELRKAQ